MAHSFAQSSYGTLATLVELAVDLSAVLDESFRFEELNPAWEASLGWSTAELCAAPITNLLHPDDIHASLVAAADILTTDDSVACFEVRLRHKSGRWVPLSWTVKGRDGRFYCVARDMTEIRRRQSATHARAR